MTSSPGAGRVSGRTPCVHDKMQEKVDELTRYLEHLVLVLMDEAINDAFDPLEWWKGNAIEYPILVRIAFNVFSISSISMESE